MALCHLPSAIQEYSSTLFAWSPARYNVHSKNTMFIPTKMSESVFFLFFIFIFQTQRQDIRLYADRQKSVGWVGKLSILDRFLWQEKRKLDHMTGCDIWYSDLSPVPHSVYENFISCLFCKLSQQEKHLQSTQSKSNLQSLKYQSAVPTTEWQVLLLHHFSRFFQNYPVRMA